MAAQRQYLDTNPTVVKQRFRLPIQNAGFNGTLPLQINRYFTDVDGLVIDKSLVPASFQLDFPVYVLGEFDRQGGYKIGQQARVIPSGAYLLMTYISGTELPFPLFTGFSTIQNYIQPGDLVHVYVDSLSAPSYYCFIVQSFKNFSSAGWGSVLSNLHNNRIFCLEFDYYAGNTNTFNRQFDQILRIVQANDVGQVIQADVNPRVYVDPLTTAQNQFINIKLSFNMNELIEIATYFTYAVDSLQFQFKVYTK